MSHEGSECEVGCQDEEVTSETKISNRRSDAQLLSRLSWIQTRFLRLRCQFLHLQKSTWGWESERIDLQMHDICHLLISLMIVRLVVAHSQIPNHEHKFCHHRHFHHSVTICLVGVSGEFPLASGRAWNMQQQLLTRTFVQHCTYPRVLHGDEIETKSNVYCQLPLSNLWWLFYVCTYACVLTFAFA